jgi:ribosomal protein S18 acetylase RimI-like enzyme
MAALFHPVFRSNPVVRPPEILDLRHFSAAQLRPLLRDEATRWRARLHWDYTAAADMLLDYIDGRVLPGYVAIEPGRKRNVLGFAFCVYEASKAVIGDVYALHETESLHNPLCETLLTHMIEMLQATPGIDRIESQLLMFPSGALATPFQRAGFHAHERLFMTCELRRSDATLNTLPPIYAVEPWHPSLFDAAAALIHRAYAGHMDSRLNDQYQTLDGAQRFLHNIIRFPGCGTFDTQHSLALRDTRTNTLAAVILCSQVQRDAAHITQLCVDPTLRSQGLGRALLAACCTRLAAHGFRTLSLTVTEDNEKALRLYEQQGFLTQHRFEAMVWNANR